MKAKILAKLKSKSFWTAAAGALTLLLSALGIQGEVAQAVLNAVGGVLVALGVIAAPCGKTEKEQPDQSGEPNQSTEEEPKE